MIRPSPLHQRLLLLVLVPLWLSGAAYLVLRATQGTLFSLNGARGFWGSFVLEIHAAFALAALVALGSLSDHVIRAWPTRRKRLSGVFMILGVAILMITTWLLYYAIDDTVRNVAAVSHSIVGVLILAAAVAHGSRRIRSLFKIINE